EALQDPNTQTTEKFLEKRNKNEDTSRELLETTTETKDQVKGRLLLDVVVSQCATILKLLSSENETLLVWRDTFLVLDLRLHVVNSVRALDFKGDCLAGKGFHEYLHATTETQHQVKSRLLLNVVIGQCATILELLSSEDETLLVRRNTFLVLDLRLHVVDCVRALDLQGDCLAGECLHENLHTTTETEDQVKRATILELLAGEDQPLLVRGNAFLILNLSFDIVNGVGALDFKGNSLAGKGLHEDLHTTTKTQHQVKRRLLLNVVVGQGATVFKLLSGEDQPLLVRRNTLLVLDLGFHVINGVRAFNLQSDSLPRQGLDKDLHTTTETKDQVKRRLLLDVVVSQSSAIFKLLPGEDQSLLIRRNTFLVLDLGFHVVNSVGAFNLQSDGLSGQRLDEDLHTTTEPEHEMKGRLLLDVVIGQSSAVFQLLSGEDKPLLIRRNPFLILDFGFNVVDGVRAFNLEGDCLPGESLNEDLHLNFRK
ncbi:unnamed protein product, partial [Thlaspi arvense]